MRLATPAIVPLWLTLAAGPAAAHDIWLQADAYRLAAGDTLTVRQLVGEELTAGDPSGAEGAEIQELPVLLDLTPRFLLLTAKGEVDLLAELRRPGPRPLLQPVVERLVDDEGPVLVVMDHATLYTDHSNEEFLEYLEHEGLDPAEYRPHMAPTDYQSEGYVRSLKALVRVGEGGAGSGLAARPVGHEIEILLLEDPEGLAVGDTLAARVLLRGEPLAGQRVQAHVRDGERVVRQEAVTDADGVARLQVGQRGLWLLRLVHLAPCSPESPVSCDDANWESYWSAFTFEVD